MLAGTPRHWGTARAHDVDGRDVRMPRVLCVATFGCTASERSIATWAGAGYTISRDRPVLGKASPACSVVRNYRRARVGKAVLNSSTCTGSLTCHGPKARREFVPSAISLPRR